MGDTSIKGSPTQKNRMDSVPPITCLYLHFAFNYKTHTSMKQVYHSNATTNILIRSQIHNSQQSYKELAITYRISSATENKWHKVQNTQFIDKLFDQENITQPSIINPKIVLTQSFT